ncbi:hypothetical protein HUT19_40090 [Streptomyces sp. NA02950]|uniref:hypothetical protein n=1 Tax=Streptomyces sp. NA02950 TaxID=2742137 RepID=UPI001592AB3D|nr:hypothetical protein [Streptomyces sp. NA02950]QKV97120.1 hypothetical protein HUT19_40090 [Streptomyces sp. NA02950]
MAKSSNSVTSTWGALHAPDAQTFGRLQNAGSGATRLVACGGGRDAVVISPLQRGLAALDGLDLPVEDGLSVLADHMRQELIVLVEDGSAPLWADVQGVRVLSLGSWLLVPTPGGDGSLAAAWLSPPKHNTAAVWTDQDGQPSLGQVPVAVDARDLHDALSTVDRPTVPSAAS